MTSSEILCYRCGASLAALTLPFSRRDMCPACSVHVHACRQCAFFDRNAIGQCLEEEAEEVLEKERVNFCEWFRPSENAYDAGGRAAHDDAARELAALFGEDADSGERGSADADAAEDLFK